MSAPADNPDHLSSIQQDARAWYVRRQRAEWRAEEERAFLAWLSVDPLHRDAYVRCEALARTVSLLSAESVAHLRGRLAIDKARAGVSAEGGEPLSSGVVPAASAATAPARALTVHSRRLFALLLFMIVFIGLAWHHQYAQPVFAQSYASARGELMDVPLPDGSHVQLDTETEIDVVFYRQRRELVLRKGQAMFSVQADAARPFRVAAGQTRVTVVGTRFSVRNTPQQVGMEAVQVAVERGRVRVSANPDTFGRWLSASIGGPPAAELVAGQQVVSLLDGEPGPIRSIPPEAVAPWRNYRISFLDTPLGQALAELGRYVDTGLVIRDARVAELRISGSFDPRQMDALKRLLPHALPVRLVSVEGAAEIVPAR
ncbi:FecR family protein [Rhodocyclus tenuis]|uniref:FecR family protein n=1 Tax=Rhodocyclus tenuis TaxID=1066 RepID=UPI0019053F8E|nr:FecR domain-containing protein [Rhodocyclus tenuis]MBK1679208.1 hypothetical protein [Rhodocyclus tenuis]